MNIAFCLRGQPRTFLNIHVQNTLRHFVEYICNLHGSVHGIYNINVTDVTVPVNNMIVENSIKSADQSKNYSTRWVVDLNEFTEKVSSLLDNYTLQTYNNTDLELNIPDCLQIGSNVSLMIQFEQVKQINQLIKKYEDEHTLLFDYVVVTRPDLLYDICMLPSITFNHDTVITCRDFTQIYPRSLFEIVCGYDQLTLANSILPRGLMDSWYMNKLCKDVPHINHQDISFTKLFR